MKIDLSGRTALVTGGSGDLGRVICRTLSECGARVVVHYHGNKEKADALVDEIIEGGGLCSAVKADVTDEKSLVSMKEVIDRDVGKVDILVNAAVIQYEPKQSVLSQPIADFESQFKSCVVHNVLMARLFVPSMIGQRWGRVIGINTECAMLYNELHSAYVSGKRGMDGVLRVLAKEIGEHQVTVNQIAPGFMISDRERDINRFVLEGYDEFIPLKRRGEDQDIANAVVFLASDLAGFITGAFLPVCGGHIMPGI